MRCVHWFRHHSSGHLDGGGPQPDRSRHARRDRSRGYPPEPYGLIGKGAFRIIWPGVLQPPRGSRCVDGLGASGRPADMAVELRHTPDDAAVEVSPWAEASWQLTAQGDGDLGVRLERAVLQSVAAGFTRTLIIGTDCPYLTLADLREAREALASNDLVLGPAEDGGYWLIGLRNLHPELFRGIPWSTESVLATTLARAQEARLKVRLLRTLADVDTAADWRRFLAR